MVKVLVTGATGNIGTPTVKALRERQAEVRAAVRDAKKPEAQALQAVGAQLVEIDFSKPETLVSAVQGVDTAWLEAIQKAGGVKHLVKLSAAGIDGGQITLAKWHLEIEALAKALPGITFTSVRPPSFFQNIGNYSSYTIKNQGAFYLPFGDAKYSEIDARDVGEVIAVAVTDPAHQGKILEINGTQSLSAAERAAIISKAVGKEVKYVDIPPEKAREAMLGHGMPAQLVDALLELYAVIKAGWANNPNDSVKKILGRDARTFEQYVADHVALFK